MCHSGEKKPVSLPRESNSIRGLSVVVLAAEPDIVMARQRARALAQILGLAQQDQVRLATAVSEIARNAYQYAAGGRVEFDIEQGSPSFLWVTVTDSGPGIRDTETVLSESYSSPTGMGIGMSGSRRLVDAFDVRSTQGAGTVVRMAKVIPASTRTLEEADIARIRSSLATLASAGPAEELQRQNREIFEALEMLQQRESELRRRQIDIERLNTELEETNRGVVALYGELEERAAELKRAAEMKSRILSHVSHEFRTPANSVLALTQVLLRRTDGELTAEQEKQVGYIRQAAQELSEMVNDLLDLAKVEAGKTDLRLDLISVRQLFGAIRALMRPLATNDAVNLVFEEPADDLILNTDESKVNQILRNLVSNALKFTEHGEIRVSAALSSDQQNVEFRVSDTGIGIAPEDQDVIFQEFGQVFHRLQSRAKGTGLGLSLSRKLATLLGGSLRVESILGAGSTFILSLPAEQAGYAKNAAESNNIVLVIDDQESSRYLVHRLFRNSRFRVVEASGGVEGSERIRFERPALVILDLMMPDKTGFEVLEELRSDPFTARIPVVIHTSKSLGEQDREQFLSQQVILLPKSSEGRKDAMEAIRRVLNDNTLFRDEPEFHEPKEQAE
jgi:signal transduction histidine kinase/CheY-like chemotaxis protein